MAMMDSRVILAGQQADIMGSYARGQEIRAQENALAQQNALADLYKKQGAQILSGDQGALNALAGFDPAAAMGIQQTQQQMAYSAEDQQMQRDRLQMDREAARVATEEALAAQAANLTAEQLAAEAAQLEDTLSGAAFFYQNKDQGGYEGFLRSKGVDPAEYPFQAFPAHAAAFGGVLDAMKAFAPPAPQEPADEYGRYVAEETAAGRQPLDRIGYEQAKKGKGVSMTTTNPDGSVTSFNVGGAAGTGEPTVGQVYNPNEVASVVTMIDEIAANPNLDRVVGPIEGGGGNNIDDLWMAARTYYGGEGTALVERIGQLQNNAWLSARQMLKGGGAITDYESRKAEGAVARLSRAKSEAEFRTALKDLRDAIVEGERKLRGQGAAPAAPNAATATPATGGDMSDDDLLKLYGGE